ncbi:hypothetical protein M3Y98_00617700 [Aphelenchoides besseyi]|nr:hypothetical protein M3Y98_00617700 [Aphelenchoides besseyi]KAI6208347.1 hypothetical protein M3Y96_00105700 [Aphelenchoides besseyi]
MGSHIQSSGTDNSSISIRLHRRSDNGYPSSSDYLSSSTTDNRHIYVSTPIDRAPFPRHKESPIQGSNRHKIANSICSDNTAFSTTNPFGNSIQRQSNLEIKQVKHCGYAELGTTKVIMIPIKSNYTVDVFVEVKLDNDELSIANPFSISQEFRAFLLPCHETKNIEVKFKPPLENLYSTKLRISAIANISNRSIPKKKYQMILIGYGGVTSVRIVQLKVNPKSSLSSGVIMPASSGHYATRLSENRTTLFALKNVGHRTAFVHIKASKISPEMNQSQLSERKEEFIPFSQVTIEPPYFILEKSSRRVQTVKITVINSLLWNELVSGNETISLSIYHGPERQRLRQARYSRDKKLKLDTIEGIDFMQIDLEDEHNQDIELPYMSNEDIAIFNQELRIMFLRLLPPGNSRPMSANDENSNPLAGLKDDYVIHFDNDVVTVQPRR